MLEMLKKLGVPATVAAVVSAIVTIMPFLFKLDERYAKSEELTLAIEKLETKQSALTTEISKLAGTTEVLVAIASQKNEVAATTTTRPRVAARLPIAASEEPVARVGSAPPTAAAVEQPKNEPPKLVVEKVDVPPAPKADATVDEKREALQKAQRAIETSRRNLDQIQRY